MSVLPRPVPVPTAAGLRWGDLVLDGLEGPYPVPGEPAPKDTHEAGKP